MAPLETSSSLNISDALKRIQELEAQNEELHHLLDKAKAATTLYDFSPTGYFTLNLDGNINGLNLSGAKLLGSERNNLINTNFKQYITQDSQSIIDDFFQKVFESNSKQNCEVRLKSKVNGTTYVLIEGILSEDKQSCLLTAVDFTDRKHAEETTRISEARLKRAELASRSGNWELHLDSQMMIASEGAVKIYGVDKDHFEFDIIKKIPLPEYRPLLDSALKGLIEENKPYDIEFKIKAKDTGEIKDIHSVSTYDKERRILFGVIQDITIRKQAEEALHVSRKQFQNYFESSSVGLSVTTPDKKWIEVNQRLCKILGYTKDELTGLTWFELTHPDDLYENLKLFEQAIDGRIDNYEIDKRFIKKDGSIVYVSLSVVCQRNKNGSVHHFLSSYIDITERKLAENRIKTLSKAVEQSPTSIIITNAEGKIQFVNAKFTSLMQYTLDEVKGRNSRIFNPGHTPPEVFKTMLKTLRSGNIWQDESLNRKKDGTVFWENVVISPLVEDNGSISNFILISEDITEKKRMYSDLIQAKEKAEESDRLKTAFLHNISHEIRTPMNAIIGFSEFLNDPWLLPSKRKHFTEIITQSCNQLLSIITDIVNIATIEAGQVKVLEKELNINNTCKAIYEHFKPQSESHKVTLRYKTPLTDSKAIIFTDESKLYQALANLIGNAFKFTREGHIEFGYKLTNDNQLEFYVEDTGIGIQSEMHNEIFKRFRQVETTATSQLGGSGLGLAISKSYVELLGGKIWLTSEPNKGSVFYFTIPYKRGKLSDIPEKVTAPGLNLEIKKSKTVLIAEDQDSNFMLLKELLSDLEVNIIRVLNGIEAIEACKSNQQIDLILMDIKMPQMDGYEATKRIKEFMPNVPIIAQTAYSMYEEKEKALQAGFDNYLTKPINRTDLMKVIKKYEGPY